MLIFIVGTVLISCNVFSGDKIKVSIGFWPDSSNSEDYQMYTSWAKRFTDKYPQYEVSPDIFTYSPEAFQAKANSHSLPTVYQTWFTEPQGIVEGGYAKDITSIVQSLGWYDKMDPELRQYLTFNNKLYGIPRDGYGLGILINLNVFEDAGLASDIDGDGVIDIVNPNNKNIKYYPQTLDELYSYSRTIKASTGKDGLAILNVNKEGGWQFANYAWNFGAQLQTVDANGKAHSNLNDPLVVEAMQYLKSFYFDAEYDNLVTLGNVPYSDYATIMGSGAIGMAIVGNDNISAAINSGGMNMNDLAFVPMPAGPRGDRYSLFGGTPYMFSSDATDEEVEGAIRFLEFCGRSPEVSDDSYQAMLDGMLVASKKGMLILPEIKPWINSDYVTITNELNDQYVNVKNFSNFEDFYALLPTMRHPEYKFKTQRMYELLDQVVVSLQQYSSDIVTALNSKHQIFESELQAYQS
jgi:ABC-type glycerol-3-phosphate transport system substrate-binding protein